MSSITQALSPSTRSRTPAASHENERDRDVSRRRAAIIAFIGLVISLIGVAVAVACGAPADLATGDLAATTRLLTEGDALFRVAVLGWVVAILGDVVRAWALYVFFAPVNRSVALLAAWSMLLHDAIFAVALVALLAASQLASGGGALPATPPDQLEPLVRVLLDVFHLGFHLGLLMFSFHLLLNGWLALRSEEVPKVLAVLLFLAFAGYLLDAVSVLALADPPAVIKQIVAAPNLVGELAVIVWLLLRGGERARRVAGAGPRGDRRPDPA